jgi:hypothetical protein
MHLPFPFRALAVALAIAAMAPSGGSAAHDIADAGTIRDGPPTRVRDQASARRLRANKGVTLQWIDWDHRGPVSITVDRGRWRLRGEQAQRNGPGRLYLQGKVTEIGRDYFLFDGTIRITDTPDRGRHCEQRKVWRFAITQNRRYFRMREFEWCDELTDYIDIYF